MIDDVDELRVFVQVVRSGSLTAAARVLSLSNNQVTRRLASLEAKLGVTLIVRTTRRMELSDAGRRFRDHATRILATVRDAEDDLHDTHGLRGRVRVGLGTATPSRGLLAGFHQLLQENPELSVSLRASDQPHDVVAEGLDIVVTAGPLHSSNLIATKLGDAYAGLGAHSDYLERAGSPTRRDDLRHHDCLIFERGSPQRSWRLTDRRGRVHEVPVGGRFASDSSRVLHDALHAGLGIGLYGLMPMDTKGVVRVLPSYRFGPVPLYAVMPPGIAETRPVRAILALLRTDLLASASTTNTVLAGF